MKKAELINTLEAAAMMLSFVVSVQLFNKPILPWVLDHCGTYWVIAGLMAYEVTRWFTKRGANLILVILFFKQLEKDGGEKEN